MGMLECKTVAHQCRFKTSEILFRYCRQQYIVQAGCGVVWTPESEVGGQYREVSVDLVQVGSQEPVQVRRYPPHIWRVQWVALFKTLHFYLQSCLGARCSSVVRVFAHGAMGRRIDPSWGGPIELFLIPASAPRLV